MSSVNKAILLGNVGRDPDIRSTRTGDSIANISVATSESWVDKRSGERQERTEWHRVSVFNQHLVKLVEKAVHKGTKIYLEGTVQTRKWTGQDGVERHTTEVVIPRFGDYRMVILDKGGTDGQPSRQQQPQQQRSQQDLDDEIPF